MINYLFSSINTENGFNKKQEELIRKDILNNCIISFIPSDFDNYIKNDNSLSLYIKMFDNIGIVFKQVNLIDNRISQKNAKKLLNESDVIFLLGGIPEYQMKAIKKYDLIDYIKKCKVVMGVSAGAMNQSKKIIYKDDFDNFEIKSYNGIGITDINVFPHVNSENSKLYEEAKEVSSYMPVFALPDDSFVRIENGQFKMFGEFYYLDNHNQ